MSSGFWSTCANQREKRVKFRPDAAGALPGRDARGKVIAAPLPPAVILPVASRDGAATPAKGSPSMQRTMLIALALAALALPATADPLPKGARPMSQKALFKLYAGTTTDWNTSSAYFAPDGTVKGLAGKKRLGDTLYWGSWTVTGNEVCMNVQYRNRTNGDTGASSDCWKWFLDGDKKPWTLWSRHYDGSEPDLANGYYDGELAKMSRGDRISARFDKLQGS